MSTRTTLFLAAIASLASASSAFVLPTSSPSTTAAAPLRASRKQIEAIKEKANAENSIMETTFKGGIGSNADEEAAKIAAKIRSVKDLGWTAPAKRRGSTRPRHRAYGGSGELPIQLKANYDETAENCVEKWLTQEEFNSLTRTSGPAADTVFVALAKGAAYAERDYCEKLLAEWRPDGRTFDEAKFLASVKKGRAELIAGWAFITSLNAFFASSIVFPTNPLAKALENFIGSIQGQL